MAKTAAERQEAMRKRRDAQGLTELRGVIVRKKDAQKAKELVRKRFPVE